MRNAKQLYIDADKARIDMVKIIMDTHKDDLKKPITLQTQLTALWRLALSIGKEMGTVEGYQMAKDGKPLGQVAHVNSVEG